MSYDIYIKRDFCGTCGRGDVFDEDDLNLTYNLSPMLRAAGLPGWVTYDGKPAAQVGREVLKVLDDMAGDPEKWRAMNPENGWGDYDECLQGRLRAWAQVASRAGDGDVVKVT